MQEIGGLGITGEILLSRSFPFKAERDRDLRIFQVEEASMKCELLFPPKHKDKYCACFGRERGCSRFIGLSRGREWGRHPTRKARRIDKGAFLRAFTSYLLSKIFLCTSTSTYCTMGAMTFASCTVTEMLRALNSYLARCCLLSLANGMLGYVKKTALKFEQATPFFLFGWEGGNRVAESDNFLSQPFC